MIQIIGMTQELISMVTMMMNNKHNTAVNSPQVVSREPDVIDRVIIHADLSKLKR